MKIIVTIKKTRSQSQKELESRKILNIKVLKRVMTVMQRHKKTRTPRVKKRKRRKIRK